MASSDFGRMFLSAMDTFFGPCFHFCLELARETWAKASLTQFLWVHGPNHTHSLASFQWSGLSDQRALHLTECCLQVQKWCPYKGRGVVPEPVCANKVRNGPASADQGCSISSQGTRHVHGTPCWNPPTSNNHQPSHSSTCTALNLYSACRGLWGLVVIRLSWLSGRALAAQARGLWVRLPATAGLFTFFYFCLITSNFQHGARCSEHPAIIIILCNVTELFCMCAQLTLYRPICINASFINIQMCVHVWYISHSHRNKIDLYLCQDYS